MAQRRWFIALLAALALALLGVVALRSCSRAPQTSTKSVAANPPVVGDAVPEKAPRAAAAKRSEANAKCEPGASQLCYRGDVWSLDGCDALEEKLEECDVRRCVDGACAAPPTQPCRDPEQGRCEGDVVHVCVGGRTERIDCGSRNLSCVMGAEGAQCVAAIPRGERCEGPSRCDGSRLVRCEAGRKVEVDCEDERARCMTLPGAAEAQCVKLAAAKSDAPCGPCGCPADPRLSEQRCDGVDEDGDRRVDEGLACGAMPVVAFIITDANGNSSHAPEDVDLELQRLNAALYDEASEQAALSFTLDELVWLSAPELLMIDERDISTLADDARVHPLRKEAYLPLIFTDDVVTQGVPRSGASTLPNGTCGGLQEGHGPRQGVVVVSKARSTTTVIHEVGHFLGLCHTHEQRQPSVVAAALEADRLKGCEESCLREGDGLCDTPLDPGPEGCVYDEACTTGCRGGEEPDAHNLMGYYTACRSRFSPDQIALMQHSLALRRAWYPCTVETCHCEPGGEDCPLGMSCRPHVLGGQPAYVCSLDGPHSAGADCHGPAACGAQSVCLTEATSNVSRCARLCVDSTVDCDCVQANEALRVCAQDMRD